MSSTKRKFGLKHGMGLAVGLLILVGLAITYVVATGLAERWALRTIVDQLTKATGARVELGHLRIRWRTLRVELDGLTLHGREPLQGPPLFHADHLYVDVLVESFWGRKISLGNVDMSNFSTNVQVQKDGSTNFPGPAVPRSAGKSPVQTLFDLKIAQLRLTDGQILWNDSRTPLKAQGGKFEFAMDYAAADSGQPAYFGRVTWQNFTVAAQQFVPFTSDMSAKFTLRQSAFSLTQLQWKLLHSEVDAQADLANFANPAWTFRYRGQLRLEDLRTLLRQPTVPGGNVEFTGDGKVDGPQVAVNGRYTASDVALKYQWFHPGNVSAHGTFHADQHALDSPDVNALLLGGIVSGKFHADFASQRSRFDAKARGIDLSRAIAAEDNPSLPIIPLHWGSSVDIESATTWIADFKHVESRGIVLWTPPANLPPQQIPASGRFEYHLDTDRKQVELASGTITTPASRISVNGVLSATSSSLNSTIDTDNLAEWDDFINRLRGVDAEPQVISGKFRWQGRLLGPLGAPTFEGHIQGTDAHYASLYWDELEGELTYSPSELRLARGRARRGRSSAELELTLALDNWGFLPESDWTFDASLVAADTDDLQKLAGTSYPARAVVTGQFHGKGTREHPELAGLFDASNAVAWSWHFDRARGQLSLTGDELRISNAEVRLPSHAPGALPGLVTGNFSYDLNNREIAFDLAGAGIPLEAIDRIQTPRMPVAGRLNAQVRGQGPLRAPELHATLRLIDLKLGSEVVGSFDAKIESDGHHASATIDSAMAAGRLSAKLDVTLGNDYPLTGEITAEQIDFDPFIVSAMHLTKLTGHSLIDGHFAISGMAARPETIAVEANLSRVMLDYENVKLENVGPVQFNYRKDELRLEQANLRGTDTDFHVSGSTRFAGDRAVSLRVDGAVSLQLLAGFIPQLEATGHAQVNAAVAGTLSSPRFNGRVHIEKAALRYGDFPTGLSNLAGDFNFDVARMVFDNVSAESGGGHLAVSGSVNYGEGPLNYMVTVRSDTVRVRYPVGMSWLVESNLRLVGNNQSATLSGRIVVDRLLVSDGFDMAGLVGSAKEPISAPSSTSPFLRNLQFDIQADSSADSRLEWAGAHLQTDTNLRVRGTWEHPILLGHVHLLSGDMNFRGNKYTISRGDINFANPFRLDPVLNVEATTTIRQYEVTLDFTGSASHLTLAYRSDPPLPPGDIIALLALGQTNEQSAQRNATGANSGLGASALLSEAISSQLGGRIERLFGISHFRVGPSLAGLSAQQQNSIASVTIEQQITPGLVVTYITDITTTQYQIIQVEYTINREFSVVGLRDENGTFGLDVVRRTRFK